jgi:hypothetical protein
MLSGVLAYPVPCCHPYFYHVDLLIPDGLSFEQFSELVHHMHYAFKKRGFCIKNIGYSITLVPASIYNWPLAFFGSPYPFLREHIRLYGRSLKGPLPKALESKSDRKDLVNWCRIFLPYCMLNLARKNEYSARTLNFYQLAGIRLFLETDEIETDPLVLRERHRERFKNESPVDHVWSYMMKDKPGRQKRRIYREATVSLLREIRWVEAFLAGNHSTAV